MKKLLAIGSLVMSAALFFSGCTKVDEPLTYHENGSPVTLTPSATTVAPTVADSTKKILAFTWTDPKYSTAPSNYKFIVEIDSVGKNFSAPARREVIGKQGDSITGRELNAILLDKGYAVGSTVGLDVRVVSSYSNNNEQYKSNTVKVVVTPYADPSVFSSSATTVTGSLNTSSQNALTFSWTPSFVGYSGVVTYALQYDSSGKNFASPHEMPVGASLLSRTMTQGEMNTTALDEGVAGGSAGKIEYRVKATTAQGATAYSNAVPVTVNTYVPLIRLYMPGSYQAATGNGADWDPPTAPEFVRDLRPEALNKLYYMYIYLPANSEFKITDGRSWTTNYGGSGGNLALNSNTNLKVTAAGVYRISVDLANMKYDIREGRMGFVGGAVGAGWTPPNVFPNYAMSYAGKNLFVGLTNFTVDGWKMIDHNDWNSSDISATNARSYGSKGPSGSTLLINGDNMPNPPSAGRYRVIWDGRDVNNVKYEMSAATEMRVVGDGINQAGVGDWDPGSSPQMTYAGNGVWTITLALKAGKDIKFLAGNAWGAFDYEDAGAGVGTGVRRLKWEGGDNFKTPATAGTYTITLNENNQTVTIN
jgi:starch-binding outer membrane protein SusE/F